jgi:SAM-dependent methyltransferase
MFLTGWGARRVVGIDREFRDSAEEAERWARLARARLGVLGRPIPAGEAVATCQDDIAASTQADASFDLVCSWRTLEHLADPRAAFAEMYRLLRPGGLAYHEYNPFFGLDGGHSLVTLDIPWGHVRFDRTDLASYLEQHRPAERERALAYYDNCLNRMTIADVERFARAAGFDVLALIPRTRTEDLLAVNAGLLRAATRNYPDLTVNDLICRIVRIVLRRPVETASRKPPRR